MKKKLSRGRGRPKKVLKNDSESEEMINYVSVDPLDVKLETVFSVEEIDPSEQSKQKEIECYKKQIWKIKKENEFLIEENTKLKDLNLDLQYEMKILKEKIQTKTQLTDPQTPLPSFSKNRSLSISSEDIADISLTREQSDDDSYRSRSYFSEDESDQEEINEETLVEEMDTNPVTYEKFIEPIISTEGTITLSHENELLLKLHSDEAKDDTKFINQLLLSLYPREDLQNISVTGTPARNGEKRGTKKKCISPNKLTYIYERMSERVERSSGTFQEKVARMKQSKVRCCINQKLQYECKRERKKVKKYYKNREKTGTTTQDISVKMEEIQLSKQREILLKNISNNSKDDSKFVNCLMLGLYRPEELTRLSVTGRTSNNKKMTQIAKEPMCTQKLLYIFKRMDERVNASDDTFEEKFLRKKRSAIKRRINEKLQYIAKHTENIMEQSALEENSALDDGKVDIKLSAKREIILSNISIDSKDDSKFIRELLISLYKSEELTNLSVTGKATRNSKFNQNNKNCISAKKMQYIFQRMENRVESSYDTFEEKEIRKNRNYIHRMINHKLQYICKQEKKKTIF